jgi:hypothetical protein
MVTLKPHRTETGADVGAASNIIMWYVTTKIMTCSEMGMRLRHMEITKKLNLVADTQISCTSRKPIVISPNNLPQAQITLAKTMQINQIQTTGFKHRRNPWMRKSGWQILYTVSDASRTRNALFNAFQISMKSKPLKTYKKCSWRQNRSRRRNWIRIWVRNVLWR